jgi:hypothetical protein
MADLAMPSEDLADIEALSAEYNPPQPDGEQTEEEEQQQKQDDGQLGNPLESLAGGIAEELDTDEGA